MDIRLKDMNAIVCGSSKGIGKAIAFEYADLGANVTMVARSEELLKENLSALKNDGSQNHSYRLMDFNKPDSVASELESLKHIPYHILVNNSGGPPPGQLIDAEEEEFTKAFNRHLIVNHILVRSVFQGMKNSAYGRIINIISTSVKQPIPGLGVSNTIRGAVANWAKTLAGELGIYGITVNNILPGYVDTGRLTDLVSQQAEKKGIAVEKIRADMVASIPVGRISSPKEIAYAAAFLASPAASYINGINLPVDGGKTSSL